jgi:serpin B
VLDAFKEVNVAHYEAEIRNVDFRDLATNALINNWCFEKTHGKIPEIVDKNSSLSQLFMCLLNALYFKGAWTLPFDKSQTREATFRNEDGSASPVQMMTMNKELNYSYGTTFDLLELPYGNEAFAMDLLLPREGVSLSEVVESLTAEQWAQTVTALQPATLSVQLPRFKIEYTRGLNRDLNALGMASLFNGTVDLSRIHPELSRMLHPELPVVVSVSQKTYAEVHEEGTEAAAVTIVEIFGSSGGAPAAPPAFHFDRPFVFLIREKTSGAIFFTGIVRSLKE